MLNFQIPSILVIFCSTVAFAAPGPEPNESIAGGLGGFGGGSRKRVSRNADANPEAHRRYGGYRGYGGYGGYGGFGGGLGGFGELYGGYGGYGGFGW